MSPSERAAIVASLTPPSGWRYVEALVAVGGGKAYDALRHAAQHGSIEVLLPVADRAPALVPDGVRTDMPLRAHESAEIMTGLSAALDQMEAFHPPVIAALFAGLIERDGDIAYRCAATLAVNYGKITSRLDWSMRPLFRRLNAVTLHERHDARNALPEQLGLPPVEPSLDAPHTPL